MDGRIQLPVIEWIKKNYSVDYVDVITEAGPVKILSESLNAIKINSIRERLEISMKKHSSSLIFIVAHHDCAGNPVEKETQLNQLRSAVHIIKSMSPSVKVVGLWVDDNWKVYKVIDEA